MDNEYSFQQMVIGKLDEHGHRYYAFQKRKKLKMDQRPNFKMQNYKSPRIKHSIISV